MRNDQWQSSGKQKGSRDGWVGAVMGLALVAGALLSMGGAPTKHATSYVDIAQPAGVVSASAPDSILPGEAIADRDCLDLQLD